MPPGTPGAPTLKVLPPKNLRGVATSSSARLSWTAGTNLESYRVYRSLSSGTGFSLLTTIAASDGPSHEDTTVAPATTYFYRVTGVPVTEALDKFPTGETVPTNEVSVSIAAPPPGATAPTNLTVIPDRNVNRLSWEAGNNLSSYRIYRASVPAGPFTLIGTTPNDSTLNFNDTTATVGQQSCYRVTGVSVIDGSETAPTNTVCVFTGGNVAIGPSNLRLQTSGAPSITLVWTSGFRLTRYNIYRANQAGGRAGAFTLLGTVAFTSTQTSSFVDTTVAVRTPYCYYVTGIADNDGHETPRTNIECAAVLVFTPPVTVSDAYTEPYLGVRQQNIILPIDWSFRERNALIFFGGGALDGTNVGPGPIDNPDPPGFEPDASTLEKQFFVNTS